MEKVSAWAENSAWCNKAHAIKKVFQPGLKRELGHAKWFQPRNRAEIYRVITPLNQLVYLDNISLSLHVILSYCLCNKWLKHSNGTKPQISDQQKSNCSLVHICGAWSSDLHVTYEIENLFGEPLKFLRLATLKLLICSKQEVRKQVALQYMKSMQREELWLRVRKLTKYRKNMSMKQHRSFCRWISPL